MNTECVCALKRILIKVFKVIFFFLKSENWCLNLAALLNKKIWHWNLFNLLRRSNPHRKVIVIECWKITPFVDIKRGLVRFREFECQIIVETIFALFNSEILCLNMATITQKNGIEIPWMFWGVRASIMNFCRLKVKQ